MRIRFFIPQNGYSAEITKSREDGEYPIWVNRKFGTRIRELISDDFTIEVQDDGFIADFVYEDDAYAFLKTFGGRISD
ncbi:hypothetical protein [Mycoplana ramosa]|uniref:Uncharacterized protein n=1 Tax=Mycoplana ramosa TaxID=40837 RepID=A0ABW3YQA0_MYCRA